jgi:hypothetical protein
MRRLDGSVKIDIEGAPPIDIGAATGIVVEIARVGVTGTPHREVIAITTEPLTKTGVPGSQKVAELRRIGLLLHVPGYPITFEPQTTPFNAIRLWKP